MINQQQISFLGSICSLVAFCCTGFVWIKNAIASAYADSMPAAPVMAPSPQRLYTVLFLGIVAAIVGGIVWSLLERAFQWKIGAGGTNEGWSAVAASTCTTLPLIMAPLIYQRLAQVHLVPPRHIIAGAIIVVTNALGWVIIFGWKRFSFRGLKEIIEVAESRHIWLRGVLMEFGWALMNFLSVVLLYRIIVESQYGPLGASTILKTAISALVFWSGMSFFRLVRIESQYDPAWIQVRGVVGGLFLLITMTGGILM